MKNYRKLLVFIICMILAGFAGSIVVVQKFEHRGVDMIVLNDIVQTAKENRDDISRMGEYDFGVDYAIYDADGRAVFAAFGNDTGNYTGDATDFDRSMNDYETAYSNIPTHYTEAVKNRYPCMAIAEGQELFGNAVILDNQESEYKRNLLLSLGALILSGLCLIAAAVLWGVYVERNIIKPFRKMEQFAGEVAAGNLDAPMEMDRNNLFGVFTESFDIMREELAKARETEIRLKQQEKEMVASLSHDLKTPITGIKLTAELMQAKTADSDTNEKLGNIYQKADQIDALVSDLFTATLKDLGEMEVRVKDEDSSILHEFVKRCDDRKKVSETDIPQCLICIDAKRMEQIIGNVIANSYKYADSAIDITYSIIEGYLKMSIRDYGPGVSEDEVKLVTNKFYRSKVSREGKAEGSGLGLYIAKTLIEKMNGEIRCLNAEPGFEVWLLIPLS